MRKHLAAMIATAGITALALSACSGGSDEGGPVELDLWTHSAGNPGEMAVIEKIVADYNASQDDYEVVIEAFPQGAYNDSVSAAAASGDVACIIDLDGPIMPNWAWAGYLAPLELPSELTDRFLPSTVGVYQDEIYAVGHFDAALTLIGRESALERNGIRIPDAGSPWTLEEFDAALETLSGDAEFEHAIDLSVWDSGEWWSYAYSPMLQSFGGDLLDRSSYLSADGVLNGAEAVAFGEWFQSVFERGLASTTPTEGAQDFPSGAVPLSYSGVWNATMTIDAFGDDVVFLPVPDFGHGSTIGGASWQWGITSSCEDLDGARDYLEFSLQDEYVAAFSDSTGLIPATAEAAALTENYSEGGRLEQMTEFSREFAVVRPETPAYAVISAAFEKAVRDIVAGADPQSSLDQAVTEIDANIRDNDGYGY